MVRMIVEEEHMYIRPMAQIKNIMNKNECYSHYKENKRHIMNNCRVISTYMKWEKNSKHKTPFIQLTNIKMENWNYFLSV